jgi:hypothetical protein
LKENHPSCESAPCSGPCSGSLNVPPRVKQYTSCSKFLATRHAYQRQRYGLLSPGR